ncbi:MAG: Gfo/Idh/MocA family oxidoreductase [Fimbriimonadales bacterium]|nr:Gfo/Idh/MocA family oxidoreductase [Fimbriimonadales bacterium]MDW8052338.1 Gfo/Idh/MocA family oxidoreductase [Armatimonadota bacterium]
MSQLLSRREFLKASVALSALPVAQFAHAYGSDIIKVGLVGCGGRGTGAAMDCLRADEGTVIWALGDIFEDRLAQCYEGLSGAFGERVQVPPERRFIGFDAYKRVLESGIDLVLLCTPPAFRPVHFLAAVEAGKHVFMEKPVAVCPEGVRMILRGDAIVRQKRLGVMPGTQYRWHPGYQGVIERIHAGHIGEIRAAYAYYLAASPNPIPRKEGWSDMVYQLRNWLFYTWLAGDQPVEQFVHNIDVMNWVMGSVPVRAIGMGGRQARTAPEYGDVYDHFAIEYEYPNGVRVVAMCRQMDNVAYRVSNLVVGSEGTALMQQFTDFYVRGKQTWEPGKQWPNPYVEEHRVLLQSIRKGEPINETRTIAESTLTAIMGRMAAYTGKVVSWNDVMNSKLNYVERVLNIDYDSPAPRDPVPIPGRTPLI